MNFKEKVRNLLIKTNIITTDGIIFHNGNKVKVPKKVVSYNDYMKKAKELKHFLVKPKTYKTDGIIFVNGSEVKVPSLLVSLKDFEEMRNSSNKKKIIKNASKKVKKEFSYKEDLLLKTAKKASKEIIGEVDKTIVKRTIARAKEKFDTNTKDGMTKAIAFIKTRVRDDM